MVREIDGRVFADVLKIVNAEGFDQATVRSDRASIFGISRVAVCEVGGPLQEGPEDVEFAVDSNWLSPISAALKGADRAYLDGGVLHIESGRRRVRRNILAKEPDRPRVPTGLPVSHSLRLPAKDLVDALKSIHKALSKGDDACIISFGVEGSDLKLDGNPPGEVDFKPELPSVTDLVECVVGKKTDELPSLYSIDYPFHIVDALDPKTECVVEWALDNPLSIVGTSRGGLPFRGLLAPRVRVED